MTYGVPRPELRRKIAEKERAQGAALLEQLLIQEITAVRRKIRTVESEKSKLERKLQLLRQDTHQ